MFPGVYGDASDWDEGLGRAGGAVRQCGWLPYLAGLWLLIVLHFVDFLSSGYK